mmetsp:Transcript_17385/g.41654  ORF Transcript_17385/g.41654 Transcript_17385/m.41654 type:complete len:254 (-) Transcript_17385:505-1266(-)
MRPFTARLRRGGRLGRERLVDVVDHPREHGRVELLAQPVAHLRRLHGAVVRGDPLGARLDPPCAHARLQLRGVALQQPRRGIESLAAVGRDDARDVARPEVDVAEVEDAGEHEADASSLCFVEADRRHRLLCAVEVVAVPRLVAPLGGGAIPLEVMEELHGVGARGVCALTPPRGVEPRDALVEGVEGALADGEVCHARLLEQVSLHARRRQPASLGEVDEHQLAEARRVVVPHGLRAAERLHDRVGAHHLCA